MGELTLTGTQQANRLGKALRARYGSLLAGDDLASLIVVRSTNVHRCVLTARAVLGGLLGVEPGASSESIAIRTVENKDEDLTPMASRCGRLAEMWEDARQDWTDHANPMHPSARRVTEHLRGLMDRQVRLRWCGSDAATDMAADRFRHGHMSRLPCSLHRTDRTSLNELIPDLGAATRRPSTPMASRMAIGYPSRTCCTQLVGCLRSLLCHGR